MSYSNNIITSPVSIYDLQQCLGSSSTDLGALCTHNMINMWAKYKPIKADVIRPLNYAAGEQIMNYKAGLSCIYASSFNAFKDLIVQNWDNGDYINEGDFVAVKYDKPTGGANSPYRLTDFNGYRRNAYLASDVIDGNNQTVGWVSSVYSKNIIIDLRSGNRADVTLPDDTTLITNYQNWMSATIGTRENLHVYDVINWQLSNGAFSQNLRRGMLIIGRDGFKWSSVKLPWSSDTDWMNTLGSSSGANVKCIEFYTNVKYEGGVENKSGTFIAIPQFSYITKCYTDANFSGSYPATTPSGYVEIFLRCDAPITTFYDLFITLQINYNGSLWEDVALSSIYQLENGAIRVRYGDTGYTDDRAVYENAYRIQSGDIGKMMRIKIWGRLKSPSEAAKDFYTTSGELITN